MKATGPTVRDIRRVVKRLRHRPWYRRLWYAIRKRARLYWCERCRKRWNPTVAEPRPDNAILGLIPSGRPFEKRYVCTPCMELSQRELREYISRAREARVQGGCGGNSER